MSNTETRLLALINENMDLGRDPDFDLPFGQAAGVSSMDCVAFYKLVSKEFGLDITPEEWVGVGSLRGLAAHIDAG